MPIQSFTSAEAGKNVRRNPAAAWPDGRRRGQRLEGIVTVEPKPSFTISPDDKIMTIGSCFAREIEKALAAHGFDLPTTALALPAEERASATANDILNKYTVHSMANEIEWAFEGMNGAPEDLFVTAGQGLWHDPHLIANMDPVTLERAIERRNQVLDIMRRLPECRIVVITLGLGEAWYDTKLGIYLNVMPPQTALAAEPERFRLDVMSYDEISAGIERFLGLVKRYGHPDHKVIMTVSPVPFKATFSGGDSISANAYSKAVQRAAAQSAVQRHDNVDYFPSYEIVTLTDRKVAFTIDNIHVNPAVVDEIMRRVIKYYVPALSETFEDVKNESLETTRLASNPSVLLGEGHSAASAGDHLKAITIFSSILYLHSGGKKSVMQNAFSGLVAALLGDGRLKEAGKIAQKWREFDHGSAQAEMALSKVLEAAGNNEKALAAVRRACDLEPQNGAIQKRLAILFERNGNLQAARKAARRAAVLIPGLELPEHLLKRQPVE